MTNEHISVKALSVEYAEEVLKNIFLKVRKGEIVSVVGKSGAGKTTLLNALAGLVSHKGEIKKPQRTSFVFQSHSLFPWMTVQGNIAFGMDDPDLETAAKIIRRIGLEGRENALPAHLSGGQQQRVAIGRALAAEPDLLLLDEPFASLDSYTRLGMQNWLSQIISGERVTTILVTHDVDEAILLSDRVLVLKNGIIAHDLTVPFTRPRGNEIKYLPQFQEFKKSILDIC